MTVKQVLRKLKISGDLKKYLVDSVEYCKKQKIDPLGVNLQSKVYPYLANKYEITEVAMKCRFIKALREFNKENADIIQNYFEVHHKITVKKLIILLLLNTK